MGYSPGQSQQARKNLRICENVSLGEKRFVAVVQVDERKISDRRKSGSVSLLSRLQETKDFATVLGGRRKRFHDRLAQFFPHRLMVPFLLGPVSRRRPPPRRLRQDSNSSPNEIRITMPGTAVLPPLRGHRCPADVSYADSFPAVVHDAVRAPADCFPLFATGLRTASPHRQSDADRTLFSSDIFPDAARRRFHLRTSGAATAGRANQRHGCY